MESMQVSPNEYQFGAVHGAMRRYVEQDLLAGVSHAVMKGRDIVDVGCFGWADKERNIALTTDHLFRIFSNTKLITSCAMLLLFEEGRFALDDPVELYISQLGNRRVLRPGAKTIDDTDPARGSITIRHLMSHSSGLSYGLLDPGSLIYNTYIERKVLNPATPLSDMMDTLADLPLVFHPGTSWEYSVGTDVLARLVEVLSGQRFDVFLKTRIFDRLGMRDTGFVVPASEQHRLTAYYMGADVMAPMKPGLSRSEDFPYRGAFINPVPRLSGGGGLISSLHDMVTLLRSLLPGGDTLLKPETISLMMTNQLPSGVWIRFPQFGEVQGKGHGLVGAITLTPSIFEPRGATGELQWGGIGGTHWWISPDAELAAVLMTQRHMGFWHPFAFEFRQMVYQAVGQAG